LGEGSWKYDICVIGGCGHVGLPLAIAFAKEGLRVSVLDINEDAMTKVRSGKMPFFEEGAEEILGEVVASGRLVVDNNPEFISESGTNLIIMGTPVDEHLNPALSLVLRAVERYMRYFRDGQLIVLRSTVYPGTSEKINRLFQEAGLAVDVAFCPERILEGRALKEFYELPQIISSFTPEGLRKARELFSVFGTDIVELSPTEAELAKLFCNVWRYMKFATANEFFTIANDHGLDYYRIREAMTHKYRRAADLPRAGFAAGPCLFKDTMQLAAFSNNSFFIGHAAMLANEGLPSYVVNLIKKRMDLRDATVGILGMAFKANSDDSRESLSYKLRKILELECKRVLITDPYVPDERIVPVEQVIREADVLIIAAPHDVYRSLNFEGKYVVDVWNFLGRGGPVG